jgi:isoquinoline 1-oxidoreductase alpha subunit
MASYQLQINGRSFTTEADSDTPLLWVLRDNLGLVGTKYGCGIAQCGACTVHLNGVAVKSCSLPISAVGTKKVMRSLC